MSNFSKEHAEVLEAIYLVNERNKAALEGAKLSGEASEMIGGIMLDGKKGKEAWRLFLYGYDLDIERMAHNVRNFVTSNAVGSIANMLVDPKVLKGGTFLEGVEALLYGNFLHGLQVGYTLKEQRVARETNGQEIDPDEVIAKLQSAMGGDDDGAS